MFALARQPGAAATVRLVVHGEVDMVSAPQLRRAIAQEIHDNNASLVTVDLSDVHFLDASALAVLLQAHRDAASHASALKVSGACGMPRAVLTLCGALDLLENRPLSSTRPTPL
jgi:anti-anti-sigma factor